MGRGRRGISTATLARLQHEAERPRRRYTGRYSRTREDYDRSPAKPCLDAEPLYEGHPISFKAGKLGHSIASDVRKPLYWDLFGGAFGHTYGHHSVWQMWTPARGPINGPLMPWTEAIDQPGARQMQHARHLLESRPFLSRVPDDSVIVADRVEDLGARRGPLSVRATRDRDGSYAMVYVPAGRTFRAHMDVIKGGPVVARWFNPRDGTASMIGTFPNSGECDSRRRTRARTGIGSWCWTTRRRVMGRRVRSGRLGELRERDAVHTPAPRDDHPPADQTCSSTSGRSAARTST